MEKKPIESVLKCRFNDVQALNIHSNLHISSVIHTHTHAAYTCMFVIKFGSLLLNTQRTHTAEVLIRGRGFQSAQYAITAYKHTPHFSLFHLLLALPHSFSISISLTVSHSISICLPLVRTFAHFSKSSD